MKSPRPLTQWDASGIAGVFTDIDDTMTTDGRLTAPAYAALCSLHEAGLHVVPVTGRSAGWAHMILKTWPVRAVVAESGGLYLHRHAGTARMASVFHKPQAEVESDRNRLQACARRVLSAVPGLAPASDNAFRLVDLALDYCEEVARVPAADVERAIAMFREDGFSARASSVHINAWAGEFDKAPMALRLLSDLYGTAALADPRRWAFIGDAPNDASMFAAFANSVGVANLAPHLPSLQTPPAWMTSRAFGEGFVEFAQHLLAARTRQPPSIRADRTAAPQRPRRG